MFCAGFSLPKCGDLPASFTFWIVTLSKQQLPHNASEIVMAARFITGSSKTKRRRRRRTKRMKLGKRNNRISAHQLSRIRWGGKCVSPVYSFTLWLVTQSKQQLPHDAFETVLAARFITFSFKRRRISILCCWTKALLRHWRRSRWYHHIDMF